MEKTTYGVLYMGQRGIARLIRNGIKGDDALALGAMRLGGQMDTTLEKFHQLVNTIRKEEGDNKEAADERINAALAMEVEFVPVYLIDAHRLQIALNRMPPNEADDTDSSDIITGLMPFLKEREAPVPSTKKEAKVVPFIDPSREVTTPSAPRAAKKARNRSSR